MNKDFLPNLRSYLIILSIPLAMVLMASKVYGFGWLSLHPPEIEGGMEVTIENMKDIFFLDIQENKKIEDEKRVREEMRIFEEQMAKHREEHEERLRDIDRLERENKEWLDSFSPEERSKNEEFYKQCDEALAHRRKTNDWS